MKKIFAVAAASGLFMAAGASPALAAHDAVAHDSHPTDTLGWYHMANNPSDMTGMMESPPMHDQEHPGPDNSPDVSEAVQEVDRSPDPGGAADETDTTSANPDTAPVYEP